MRIALCWLLGLALLPSCSVTEDLDTASQAAEVKATVDTLWIRYAEAADRRDRAGFGGLFAEDAVLVRSGSSTVRGRAAIEEFLTALYSGVDVTALRVTPDELKASGPLAVQAGTFEEDFTQGGTPKTAVGRYVIVVERQQDRSWRIRRAVALADSIRG